MKFSASSFLLLSFLPAAAAFQPKWGSARSGSTSLSGSLFQDISANMATVGPKKATAFAHNLPQQRPKPRLTNNVDFDIVTIEKETIPELIEAMTPAPPVEDTPVVAEPAAEVASSALEMEMETRLNIYPSGLTEEDVTEKDAQAVQLATDRILRLCPNSHPDLMGLIFWVQNGEAAEAAAALKQLLSILQEEQPGQGNTMAIYRVGAQVDIARSMMWHSTDEELLQSALQVIDKLTCPQRAQEIQFEGIRSFQESLVSLGVSDCAFAAIDKYPDNGSLATQCLSVVSNLIASYTFEELFEIGLMEKTMAAMEKSPNDASMLFVGCDILHRAMSQPNASRTKLEEMKVVSLLANILERFNNDQENQKIYVKAELALISTLMIGRK